MSEIKNTEAMVKDQNLTPVPNTGADNENIQKKDMLNNDEIRVPTLRESLRGEEPAKEPNTETVNVKPNAEGGMNPIDAPVEQPEVAATKNEEPVTDKALVETPAEDTSDAGSDIPESAEPTEDGTTEPKAAIKLNKLHIYSTSGLDEMGVKLARIVDNRDLDEKAVQKKIASIKKVKGVISPTQLVPARKCLEQGHEVKLLDGSTVTEDTENLDNIYVIVDGQHRDEAVRKIKNNPKEVVKFENYYYLPLIDDYVVSDLLRETNTATFPWKDRQYLNNLLMVKSDSSVNMDLLKEIQAHPKASTKAAIHYLTLETGKNIYSRDIVTAMVDDAKLAEICKVDATRFEAGKKLFKAAEDFLGDMAGTTPYSDWSIAEINSHPTVSVVGMAEKLADFFQWMKDNGKADVYRNLKGKKASKEQAYVSKDTVIRQQLSSDYMLYSKSIGK